MPADSSPIVSTFQSNASTHSENTPTRTVPISPFHLAKDSGVASALAQPDAKSPTAAAHLWDFRCSTILRKVLAWRHLQLDKGEEFEAPDYRP
jgi:hypothetical protein